MFNFFKRNNTLKEEIQSERIDIMQHDIVDDNSSLIYSNIQQANSILTLSEFLMMNLESLSEAVFYEVFFIPESYIFYRWCILLKINNEFKKFYVDISYDMPFKISQHTTNISTIIEDASLIFDNNTSYKTFKSKIKQSSHNSINNTNPNFLGMTSEANISREIGITRHELIIDQPKLDFIHIVTLKMPISYRLGMPYYKDNCFTEKDILLNSKTMEATIL